MAGMPLMSCIEENGEWAGWNGKERGHEEAKGKGESMSHHRYIICRTNRKENNKP